MEYQLKTRQILKDVRVSEDGELVHAVNELGAQIVLTKEDFDSRYEPVVLEEVLGKYLPEGYWSNIPPKYRFAAYDSDGELYLYEEEPITYKNFSEWANLPNTDCCISDYQPTDVDTAMWKQSLRKRGEL